jgi:hypothetical protein
MSQIRFVRPKKAWQDKLRAYKIFVDNQEVGAIKQQGEFHFGVAPGKHTVQLKIDWCYSPTVEVEVAMGSTASLTCEPGAHPLLSLLYITLLRKRYIRLQEAYIPAN